MRVSWYADTGVAVFSIWQGDTCTGTFRLPIPELPRMVEVLTQGPPGAAGTGPRAADPGLRGAAPGPPAAAMGQAGAQASFAGQPDDDYLLSPRDGEEMMPAGRRGDDPHAGYPGSEPGWSYGEPLRPYRDVPRQGGYDPDGEYEDARPGGYQDIPPGGYEASAPGGGYGEPEPRGGYRDVPPGGYGGPAPDGLYEEPAPDGGYRDMPPGAYQDLPPGDYQDPAPDGYRAPRPPTGPLPVGRWQAGEPAGEYPEDELRADPLGGGYRGEAEQGYLPGPPTDIFPAAPPAGSYRGTGGLPASYEHAGYESDPADPDHESPYPAHDRGDPPPEPGARPGGRRAREYGHSRGRS